MHARTGASQAAPSIIFGKQKAAGSWADLKKPLVIFHKVEGNPCHYEGAGLPASRTRIPDDSTDSPNHHRAHRSSLPSLAQLAVS